MENKPELHFETEWHTSRLLSIECAGGYLNGSYDESSGRFLIADLYVEPGMRRDGRGTGLVEHAKQVAIERGATVIWASIVSREALDIMTRVFGKAAVTVDQEGEYAPKNPQKQPRLFPRTSAILHATIEQ